MKTIFTILIGLVLSFTSIGQNCNAYFQSSILQQSYVEFTDYSFDSDSMTATSWTWNFGDGTSSTDQSPAHNFSDISTNYYVCLTANFDNGCSSTFCDSVYFVTYNDSTNLPVDSCDLYVYGDVTDVSYIGATDGAIDLTVYGGTAPYTYNWDNGATTQNIAMLAEGSYFVEVLDAEGCITTNYFSIYAPYDSTGNPNVIDSLISSPIDTCIDFVVIEAYVSNITMIDSLSFLLEWTFIDDQQQTHIFYETYNFTGQQGNFYVQLTIDCNQDKAISFWGDVITIDGSITTGITTIETVTGLNLYPNPVKDVATIEYNLTSSSNVTISIIDYTGKVLNSTSVNSYQGNNTVTLSTSNLTSGIYFARIISKNTVKTIKFIK